MRKSVSTLTLLVATIIAFDIIIVVVDADVVVKTNNSLVRNKRNLAPKKGGYYGTDVPTSSGYYASKKSKSSKKKSKGGYYGTDNPTSSGYYTSKKSKSSKKSDKSCKSKSAKESTEEGCDEETEVPTTGIESEDVDVDIDVDVDVDVDVLDDEDEDEDEVSTDASTSKSCKSCKDNKSNKSKDDKSNKSNKSKDDKSTKSIKSEKVKSSKSEKSLKSIKSEKSFKSEKNNPTPAPVSNNNALCSAAPVCKNIGLTGDCCPSIDDIFLDCCSDYEPDDIDKDVFVPKEIWKQSFNDVDVTSKEFIFYDSSTKFAWYVYNADVTITTATSLAATQETATARIGIPNRTIINNNIFETTEVNIATLGRICPIDTQRDGKIMESLCIEIKPSTNEGWETSTSTEIQSVEVCYGDLINREGAILKMAVVVRDNSTFKQFFNDLVGSRMIVYDMILAGSDTTNNNKQSSIDISVEYEGWTSLYGEPAINGRPAFSSDCKSVYATWITNPASSSTTTIATSINGSGSSSSDGEKWRAGSSTSRFVGLTPSNDGESLFSAINIAVDDDGSQLGGMVQLNATNGQIISEYAYKTSVDGLPHNAYTNVVVDDDDNMYHIDSIYGLVKFNGNNLKLGPTWKAIDIDDSEAATTSKLRRSRGLLPATRPRDVDSKNVDSKILPMARPRDVDNRNIYVGKDIVAERKPIVVTQQSLLTMYDNNQLFTAYQPALSGNDNTVFSCSDNALDDNKVGDNHGVIALETDSGESEWYTPIKQDVIDVLDIAVARTIDSDEILKVGIGSCSGITADIQWAPSLAAGNQNGIYIARGSRIECLESRDGSLLWTYRPGMNSDSSSSQDGSEDEDENDASLVNSKFVILSDRSVLVAQSGTIVSLQTTKEKVTDPPKTTMRPSPFPTPKPNSPIALPSPPASQPVVAPTVAPTSAGSFTTGSSLTIVSVGLSLFFLIL
ncbi:endo-1,3-beta-glucanase [Fragilariopsis cylindrus CCMP1102]|uniref:Endo-1,3-beta-glucanase n=1 Tax=Fragilariopsis cylindrus CCMP1102 TaxID=635003 RepID=A0A1E7FN23_9STRA|nr:endo-1,3-beta-glucanase [Fragilariopsis cylindrus CCMP1102]|eukprot:OEU19562.1 endo-1,3-beta-glucanase [Fragilariopsis cylindrus CCMP1102]